MVGSYYSQLKLNALLEKIDKLSEQKELQFVNHNILETLDGSGVEVKINIFEGKKLIIEKINIAGNTITNDSVIRGELLVDEGDPFSELLVAKSINKIKGRNIFGKVEQKTLPGSTNDTKILEINVEEKATGEIMAGAGVGTEGLSSMFSIKENNWLGKGIHLTSALSISEEKIAGNLSVADPNFRFTGNSLETSFNVSATDRAETTGYESSKTGFSLGTSFEQYEDIHFFPKISINHEDITAEGEASDSIKKMDGTYFNMDFNYGITLDKRNQSWQPTEGYLTSFYQSLPLIQDSSSIVNTYSASVWNEISENAIGALKFQAKSVHGVDENVRLTNRLFVEGRKLRGFVRGKVGPKDGSDWVGGNYVMGLSGEIQLPNLLPESTRTDVSAFLDTGNIWHVDYDDTMDDANKIRSSIGVSANMWTTVGPFSLTIAQDLTKSLNDETEAINFRLGTSF